VTRVARVCRVWGASRSRLYRERMASLPSAPRRRPGPMPDAALVEAIRQALAESPFHGEGYRKVWAQLRHAGLRTSRERVRRLMRENGLQAANRPGRPRGPRTHDGTIIPETIDTMWGTDMTAGFTVEQGQVAVFVAVDHCSAECVGIHAALHGTRHEALEPVRQGVAERFGRVDKTPPAASPYATITGPSTCPATSSARSPGSAPRPRQPSSAPPRATAAPSGSSGR
jgi:putative transposase